jgi:hypothetical protein
MDHLICSAVNGLVQSGCLISDRDRLTTFEADVHHTAHVVIPALLVTVLIAQVDVHEGDVIPESAQSIIDYSTDLISQRLVTFDVMVGIDLDLHGVLLL